MSLLTIAWSMCSAASLTIALIQLLLWIHNRSNRVYLLTALASLGAAATAMTELWLMKAPSAAAYGEFLRWQNLAVFVLAIPLVWAIYLHLGGRRSLALAINALWLVALVVNFASPTSIVYADIQGLNRLSTFWGETFVSAIGIRNPWLILAEIASLLMLIFFADAIVRSWRHDRRRPAVLLGVGAAGFVSIAGGHAALVDAGVIESPYLISFAFLTMVLAFSYDLVAEAARASRYARELQVRNRRWDALMSNVHLSVLGLGKDGRINYVNPFFERLSGYSYEELKGRPASMLLPAVDAAELARRLEDASETGPRPKSNWTFVCRSGERRAFSCSTVRQESLDGEYEGVITIAEDMTDRLAAEYELTEARRETERLMRANMLGEIVSALAHELNQPLASILSNAQAANRLLDSDSLQPQRLRDILEDIVLDDRRAAEVISRIRGMVRKDAGGAEQVQLNAVARTVIDLLQGELDQRAVRLDTALADHLPAVVADRVGLQQVLMNLMMNALRAVSEMPEGMRWIAWKTWPQDGNVYLMVEDSGPGIPGDAKTRIFEPFYTTRAGGIGMGLTICRRLIEEQGGYIWAESQDGGGARFSVRLPQASEAPPDGA